MTHEPPTGAEILKAVRDAIAKIPPRPVILTPPKLESAVLEAVGTLSENAVKPRVVVVNRTTRLFNGNEIYICHIPGLDVEGDEPK